MSTVKHHPAVSEDNAVRQPERNNRWLVALLVVLLGVVAGLAIWLIVEVRADGEATAPSVEVVDQWADAFLTGDPDAVAALYVVDGVYEERGPTQVFEGTDAIRQQLTEGFAYADATEMKARSVVVADGAVSGGDVVVVEWTISGMSASDARMPTDKTPFSVQAITIFEMDSDLIARSVFYAPWLDLFN